MKKFNYTAKDAAGNLVRDEIESNDRQAVLSELRKKGLTVVSLTEIDALPTDVEKNHKHEKKHHLSRHHKDDLTLAEEKPSKAKKVKLTDMAIFCRQLAISVNSGLSLRESLEGIQEDMDVPTLKKVLDQIIKKLHDGVPFSKAVASFPTVFSPIFIGMIRAAEEAGSLAETLDLLAGYLESSDKLRRKIKSLMAYPIFVAGFFVIICLVMVFAIVPRFEEIFSDLSAKLPLITRAIFGINRVVIDNSLPIFGIILLIVLAYIGYKKTDNGNLRISKMKLNAPYTGVILTKYVVARVCRCLSIMLRSGVPVATALSIVSRIGNNASVEKAIVEAQEKIVAGSTIALALAETGMFPALLIRMISVGENAGKLPEVLSRVSDAYEDQVEAAIVTGTSLLEPIIISIFGAMVLLLIISIYLPVFSVAAHIR
jgi:type IV pilus assembly protein PilC